MHRKLINEARFDLILMPDGPLLIKAGEGDADPTRPDMSFVRTWHDGRERLYLPGSSLKGVLRAHCERLARTAQRPDLSRLACDPLTDPCDREFRREPSGREKEEGEPSAKLSGASTYAGSCFLCQMFGNNSLGSHFRIEDAYPEGDDPRIEERNGVAIDRVFGSVAFGPFNYEAATTGRFRTRVALRNFSLAQLGLLSLALRDLVNGEIRIGFGKSRGLGVVKARVDGLVLRYPTSELADGCIRLLGRAPLSANKIYGVGAFASVEKDYKYPEQDEAICPTGYELKETGWLGVEIVAPRSEEAGADWQLLGRECVNNWRQWVTNGN